MPNDNEQMLQAYVNRKTVGTDNQKISEAYQESRFIEESIFGDTGRPYAGAVGAGAAGTAVLSPGTALGAAGLAGSAALAAAPFAAAGAAAYLAYKGIKTGMPHNRAAQSALKFATGRGGGISQLLHKFTGAIGGAHMDQLKAQHGTQDTANYLWKEVQGLLGQFPNGLTGEQIRDFLRKIPIAEGKDNINPDKLPSTKLIAPTDDPPGLVKDRPYSPDEIMQLFIHVAEELYQIIKSGSALSAGYITADWLKNLINGLSTARARAAVLVNILLHRGTP